MPSKENNAEDLNDAVNKEQWPGIDSRYRLIVIAALRSKQLQRGAHPHIPADPHRRRNTSIALEEVRQGLVPFTIPSMDPKDFDGQNQPAIVDAV